MTCGENQTLQSHREIDYGYVEREFENEIGIHDGLEWIDRVRVLKVKVRSTLEEGREQ